MKSFGTKFISLTANECAYKAQEYLKLHMFTVWRCVECIGVICLVINLWQSIGVHYRLCITCCMPFQTSQEMRHG